MRSLVVLQSFPAPRPTTNPYLIMLSESLQHLSGVHVRTFTWRAAILGQYDVFHVHWPENMVRGRTRPRRAIHQALLAALLIKLSVFRTPIVRTVHNTELPTDLSWSQRRLLGWVDRQTTLRIRLNQVTEIPATQPFATIPLGHYRDWFQNYPLPATRPGRLLFFGLVRRYKGIENLITAFRQTQGDDQVRELRIVGKPSTDQLNAQLAAAAGYDRRISMDLRFLTDAELVAEIGQAELIILPYNQMHNSASVMTALSLSRPVLIPENVVNTLLREEVGTDWIFTYSGDITADSISVAVDAVHRAHHQDAADPREAPDLTARNWESTGSEHLLAYRRAVTLAGRAGTKKRIARNVS